MMDSYYVTFRSAPNDYRRVNRYAADDFAHAEEQAQQDLEGSEEIIAIERDYKI